MIYFDYACSSNELNITISRIMIVYGISNWPCKYAVKFVFLNVQSNKAHNIPAKISPLNDGIEPPFVFTDRYLPKWQKTLHPAKKITLSGILI